MMNFRCLLLVIAAFLTSCFQPTESYKSLCDKDKRFVKIDMAELLNNIEKYDGKYVEVEGKYKSGYEETALYRMRFYDDNEKNSALWVDFDDFTVKCPLTSSKTELNLFGKEKSYKNMLNKTLKLHGIIDANEKGHLSLYKGSIKDITLVTFER